MSTLETSVLRQSTRTPVSMMEPREDDGRAQGARAFLIYLVTREIQLSVRVSGWLRTTAQRFTDEGQLELANDCVRMAAATWELREQLTAVAHRLVARRNRLVGDRRINAMQLLEQPYSQGMNEFIALNQKCVAEAMPGIELEILASVEELLADTIPFALELAGLDNADLAAGSSPDLAEAAEFYAGRATRAASLRGLVDILLAGAPDRREQAREYGRAALECFTKVTRESAELGRCLDGQPSSMC